MTKRKRRKLLRIYEPVYNQQPQQTIVPMEKIRERIQQKPMPSVWDLDRVAERLIEAARTVRRMPMQTRPQGYATAWPGFEPMTASEQVDLFNELQQSGLLLDWQREQNRVRILPSSAEIERMEESIGWIPKFLKHDRHLASIVGFWADKAESAEQIPIPVRPGLEIITNRLRLDRVPVR